MCSSNTLTSQVVFNILNIEGQFTFSISATARSKITYEFKQPGTHYWKAPTQGNVVLTLVGGGGGGGGGSGCPIPRPSPPYEWPSGGGGGGAGEYLRNIFLTLTNTRELIYTISIGSEAILF